MFSPISLCRAFHDVLQQRNAARGALHEARRTVAVYLNRQAITAELVGLIEKGRPLYDARVSNEEHWSHWQARHAAWLEMTRELTRKLLPPTDYLRVDDLAGLTDHPPVGSFDFNQDHARARSYLDRRLSNLLMLANVYDPKQDVSG